MYPLMGVVLGGRVGDSDKVDVDAKVRAYKVFNLSSLIPFNQNNSF